MQPEKDKTFFPGDGPGNQEVTTWYANNEEISKEVRFTIPVDKWDEFEKSDLFRDLKNYVNGFKNKGVVTKTKRIIEGPKGNDFTGAAKTEKERQEELDRKIKEWDEKAGSFTWIVFVSMITAIITTLLTTG